MPPNTLLNRPDSWKHRYHLAASRAFESFRSLAHCIKRWRLDKKASLDRARNSNFRGLCSIGHTGTSASAPIAAAILALVLEGTCSVTLLLI